MWLKHCSNKRSNFFSFIQTTNMENGEKVNSQPSYIIIFDVWLCWIYCHDTFALAQICHKESA